MWPVYIADMHNFQHRASDVWTVFMTVDFGCQKFDIPGAAIAWDHAGEQVKKILKKHGGFSGKTQNENIRTRRLLAAPIFSSIFKEGIDIGETNISKASSWHHQLSPVISIAGQLYLKEVFASLITVEPLGNNLFDEFVKERMQPESEKVIFDPIKSSSVKECTSSSKPLKFKVHNKVFELKDKCSLFAQYALVKD